MPMITERNVSFTATYIYRLSGGTLIAWCPDSAVPVVATSEQMTAAGLGMLTGQPPLGPTKVWDPTIPGVKTIPNPQALTGAQFVLLFTPTEAAAILASSDPVIKQLNFALQVSPSISLSDPVIIGGINYLVSASLLTSDRAAQVLAGTPHS